MTYELAKQLKDSGFPLKDPTCESCKEYGVSCGASYPTLSELIEACGEHFDCLYNRGEDWGASHFANGRTQAIGKTPEDAVANLWLALNKE